MTPPGSPAPAWWRLPGGCGRSPGSRACSVRTHCVEGFPAWLRAQRQNREGKQEGARGTRWSEDLQGAAPSRSSPRQAGVPKQPVGKPPSQIPALPAPPPPALDKLGEISHHRKDHQLPVGRGLWSLPGQSGSLIRSPTCGFFPSGHQRTAFQFWVVQRDPQAPRDPFHC